VAEHELVARGETSILDTHYDGRKPQPSNTSADSATKPRRILVGTEAIGNTRLGAELEILLALGAPHGEAALVATLRRGVAFTRFRAADMRSILAAGTAALQPARPGMRCCRICPPRRFAP
jgi:hypothetical protein